MQNQTVKERYATLFNLYTEALNGHSDEPIAQFRQAGFEQFKDVEFPTRRDEDWKYSGIGKLLNKKIQSFPEITEELEINNTFLSELGALQLTFLNGVLINSLPTEDELPTEVAIQSIADALRSDEKKEWIYEQSQSKGGTDKNAFVPLNLSFANNGLYIEVSNNYRFDRPVHLTYISFNSADNETFGSHPQVLIKVNKGASLDVIESYHSIDGQDSAYFTNTLNLIDVAANAKLAHYKIQQESREAFQVNNTFIQQGRDSIYSLFSVDVGGSLIRNNVSATLKSTGTETNLFGIYIADGKQQIDNQTFIDHATPHCQSNELYKGIITDKAKGVFNGKVLVRQDAQKINAFQQNNSLVLSETAVMDTKPQLEIYADDVRCSHGATIGQMDEQAIFYLRSRGITHDRAKKNNPACICR